MRCKLICCRHRTLIENRTDKNSSKLRKNLNYVWQIAHSTAALVTIMIVCFLQFTRNGRCTPQQNQCRKYSKVDQQQFLCYSSNFDEIRRRLTGTELSCEKRKLTVDKIFTFLELYLTLLLVKMKIFVILCVQFAIVELSDGGTSRESPQKSCSASATITIPW